MKKLVLLNLLLFCACSSVQADKVLGLNNTVEEFKEAYPKFEVGLGLQSSQISLELAKKTYFTSKAPKVNVYKFS